MIKALLQKVLCGAILTVAVAGFIFAVGIVGYSVYSHAKLDTIAEQPAPPLLENVTPEKVLEEAGAPEELRIIYTDDVEFNCGYALSLEAYEAAAISTEKALGGCYRMVTPNVIFLSTNITQAHPDTIRYITLHEYGHYVQMKTGAPLDECGADQFAATHEARVSIESVYDCEVENEIILAKEGVTPKSSPLFSHKKTPPRETPVEESF